MLLMTVLRVIDGAPLRLGGFLDRIKERAVLSWDSRGHTRPA